MFYIIYSINRMLKMSLSNIFQESQNIVALFPRPLTFQLGPFNNDYEHIVLNKIKSKFLYSA